jgi:hypothetical protein
LPENFWGKLGILVEPVRRKSAQMSCLTVHGEHLPDRVRPLICGAADGTARPIRRFSDLQQWSTTGVPRKRALCEIPWPKNSPVRTVPLNRSFIQTFQRTMNTSHAAGAAQFWRPYRSSDSSSNVTSCLRVRPLAAADIQAGLTRNNRSPAETMVLLKARSAAAEESAQTRPNCLRNSPLARVNMRRRVGERLVPARLM